MLELHHCVPFAAGGTTDASNLEIRCRMHNSLAAELYFGARRDVAGGHPVGGAP
jgi:hypothetical protein